MGRAAHLFAASFIMAASCAAPALSQEFPQGNVNFVVPFPAGGTVDLVGRAIAKNLATLWGKPVLVVNKPGAGNIVGATMVTQAKPDGHTLFLATTSVSANPALFKTLPFDTEKDLKPVAFLASSPNVLLVQASSGVKTLDGFLKAARESGDKPMSYASVGSGSGHHICMEMLQAAANVKLNHIIYPGVAQAVAAFHGGEVMAYCSDITGALGILKQGRATTIALTGKRRVKAMPDVPTFEELGLKGVETAGYIGIMTTGGTPDAIVQRLNADVRTVVEEPAFVEQFSQLGYDMAPESAESFARFIAAETQVYKDIVKKAGIPQL
ncbi:MAG: putative exported protein [Hyphomicrobiales bacterium]|nr:putative exported protein [Hyphomicrobiales bacterium]